MTTDQQDKIILGFLRSHFAVTSDPIVASTIAARTAIRLDDVEGSLERLATAGLVDVTSSEEANVPTQVQSAFPTRAG